MTSMERNAQITLMLERRNLHDQKDVASCQELQVYMGCHNVKVGLYEFLKLQSRDSVGNGNCTKMFCGSEVDESKPS